MLLVFSIRFVGSRRLHLVVKWVHATWKRRFLQCIVFDRNESMVTFIVIRFLLIVTAYESIPLSYR
jgi:hypothetical protein